MPSPAKVARQAARIRLLCFSVLPAVFGIVLGVSALDVAFAGWTYAILVLVLVASMVSPYAVGWLRSLAALLIAGIGVLWVLGIANTPVALRTALSFAIVGAVVGLTWFSLRFGYVWKPSDATDWGPKENSNFPYPYF